jgi:hypothetical protein
MTPPLIVTGHGRSGTHWLAYLLSHFVDARHEPDQVEGDVVVDCRLVGRVPELVNAGHRVMHLVRDGRDVVRSTDAFYHGRNSFQFLCELWAETVDRCQGLPALRLEDLTLRSASTRRYLMPHWSEWEGEHTETFWRVCGEQMRRHGYER